MSYKKIIPLLKGGKKDFVQKSSTPLQSPHLIFSVEQPRWESSIKASHEDTLNKLKAKGYKAHHVEGTYGGVKENSIMVENIRPHHAKALMNFAAKAGQDSALYSDGKGNHELHYLNGPDKGTHHKGKGTEHLNNPTDNFSVMPDKTTFAHNLDFDNKHPQNTSMLFGSNPQSPIKKSEESESLIHYSPTQGLKEIDPAHHGVRKIGKEAKSAIPEHKTAFYYRQGIEPESIVTSGSKSKYEAKLQPQHKLYDLGEDSEGIKAHLQEKSMSKPINRGTYTNDDVHEELKNRGYHGFFNSKSSLPGVVAMFEKLPVHKEHPLTSEDFKTTSIQKAEIDDLDQLFEEIFETSEDPWDEAKYERGGEEHLKNYQEIEENFDEHGDEEGLEKAEPKAIKPPKAPKETPQSILKDVMAGQKGHTAGNEYYNDGQEFPIEHYNKITVPTAYRSYKHTPHQPESLFLKYAVHRIENKDKYKNAGPYAEKTKQDLDQEFLDLHQKGKAADKNGHITPQHLNDFIHYNPKFIPALVRHQKSLHKTLMDNFSHSLINEDGSQWQKGQEPHIALTRGLNSEVHGQDHSLASYADKNETGFGSKMFHYRVPLKNVWYSFDAGPKSATSEKYGNENEWLVSPHKRTVANEKEVSHVVTRNMHTHKPKDVDIWEHKLMHPKTSTQDLHDIYDKSNGVAFSAFGVKTHKNADSALIDKMIRGPNNPQRISEIMRSNRTKVSDETLQHIYNKYEDHYALMYDMLESMPNLPQNIIEGLADHPQYQIAREVADRHDVPTHVLEKLSNHENPTVRKNVGIQRKTDINTLRKLSQDKDELVRKAVAANKRTPPELLHKMLQDENPDVRDYVKNNPTYQNYLNPPTKLAASENVVSDLTKMSQPTLKFPNIRELPTRPDQEVKVIDPNKRYKLDNRTITQPKLEGKKIENKIFHKYIDIPKTAAKQVRSEIQESVMNMSRPSKGGTTGENYNMANYTWARSSNKARPPKEVQTTIDHEAAHRLLGAIEKHPDFGYGHKRALTDKLVSFLHPEDKKLLSNLLTNYGYNTKSPDFKEELLTHARDFLVSRQVRNDAKKLNEEQNEDFQGRNPVHKRLKQSWKNIANYAKQLTPSQLHQILSESEYNQNGTKKDIIRAAAQKDMKKSLGVGSALKLAVFSLKKTEKDDFDQLFNEIFYSEEGKKILHTEDGRFFEIGINGNIIRELASHQLAKNEDQPSPIKPKNDLLAMYKPEQQEMAKPFVEWTKKLPNKDWKTWAVRNHKNNPESFTKEVKNHLEHFSEMTHIPEINNHRFDKNHDFNTGIEQLKNKENQHIERIKKNTRFASKPKTAKKILDLGNGRSWWSLGKGSCKAEGNAMGHCGNVPSAQEGHDILSLRTEHNLGGKKYYEPHLTFIHQTKDNTLGEMKGRGNEKPAKHYHEDVVKLLEKGGYTPVGGGYKPENNFHPEDLSKEHAERLLKTNPNALFGHKDYMDKIVDSFVNSRSIDVRSSVAKNPNTSPEILHKLHQDEHWHVRSSVAKNPNTSPETLHKLHQDEDRDVRRSVAENPNTSPEILHKLHQDEDRDVRSSVAKNPNTSPETLHKLHQDEHWHVRSSVAENPNTSPEILHKLHQDEDWHVRSSVAKNPNTSPEILHKLHQDEDRDVRSSVAENPTYIKWLESQKKLAASENVSNNLQKTLVAGGFSSSEKVNGSALQKEDVKDIEELPKIKKPFKSKSQRRFFYANKAKVGGGKVIEEWEKETPKNIPEEVKKSEENSGQNKRYFEQKEASLPQERQENNVFWHGSPSGELKGSRYGLHLGTKQAAYEALTARIGHPVEGEWDGTRNYGKTLLAGQKTLRKRGISPTGYNVDAPEEDHYPTAGRAKFSDNTPVLHEHKPKISPYRLTGAMSNTPRNPHEDFRANALMAGQIKKGTAKRGYYYQNVGEDAGSISIVVPNHNHIEEVKGIPEEVKKGEELEKGERGDWREHNLKFIVSPGYKGDIHVGAYAPKHLNKYGQPAQGKGVAGSVTFSRDSENKTLQPKFVHVDPEFQRMGLATALYNHAENHSEKFIGGRHKIVEAKTHTDEGSKFWENVKDKINKNEDLEDTSWYFLDDDDLMKSAPTKEGEKHPDFNNGKPYISKLHPNGKLMWHSSPEHARKIDSIIQDKTKHLQILNSLPKTHQQAYANAVKKTTSDPNRHFIPTEENGEEKLRARHLRSLLFGDSGIKLDTSDPNNLWFRRESHSQGQNKGKTVSIKEPIKKA